MVGVTVVGFASVFCALMSAKNYVLCYVNRCFG